MPAPVYKTGTTPKPATPRGRPCLLTKECESKLLSAIEEGMPLKQAAMLAGISYDSLNRWRIKGEIETAPPEFRDFCKALQHSQAVAMQRLVSCVQQAGQRDWRAAAWLLERRHPEDFAKEQHIEHSGSNKQPLLPVPMEPEVLQRIRKQNGVAELMGKLGALLAKRREERKELYQG